MNFDAEIKVLNEERRQLQLKAQELTNFENKLLEKQTEVEKIKLQIEQEQANVSSQGLLQSKFIPSVTYLSSPEGAVWEGVLAALLTGLWTMSDNQ